MDIVEMDDGKGLDGQSAPATVILRSEGEVKWMQLQGHQGEVIQLSWGGSSHFLTFPTCMVTGVYVCVEPAKVAVGFWISGWSLPSMGPLGSR